MDRGGHIFALAAKRAGLGIGALQGSGVFVELACIGGIQQRVVDDRDLLDAAHGALEQEAFAIDELALPAAIGLALEGVEALGDVGRGGRRLGGIAEDLGVEHAENSGLLDDLAVVAAVDAGEDVADDARLLDHIVQIDAGALLAGGQLEHRVLEAGGDEVILHRALVLEILLGLAAGDFVERRLGYVEMAAIDQLRHLPVEERQQQGADVGAVDVGVRHDDDLVVAQLLDVELLVADAGAERGDQRADLLAAQHLVEAGALDVEDLAAQRQHGLEFAVATLLGGAAGGVALDDEQLGFGWIALLAVGQLAG